MPRVRSVSPPNGGNGGRNILQILFALLRRDDDCLKATFLRLGLFALRCSVLGMCRHCKRTRDR